MITEMRPAIDRALAAIEELKREGYISEDMARRGDYAVGYLFDRNTVYASIAPDGGDLLFYWKAGDRSVSIDLYAEEFESGTDSWGSVVDGVRHRWTYNDTAIRPEMRQHLRQFSAYVEAENPAWREQVENKSVT